MSTILTDIAKKLSMLTYLIMGTATWRVIYVSVNSKQHYSLHENRTAHIVEAIKI